MEEIENKWRLATSKKVALELKQRSEYTPDIKNIDQYEYHLVYIDNILRKKYNRQGLSLRGAKFLGDAYTVSSDYVMKRTANFPITYYTPRSINSRRTVGELYAVTPEGLRNLDVMFANGNMWFREKHHVVCSDQLAPWKNGHKRVVVECWYYLGIEESFKNFHQVHADPIMHGTFSAWEWDPDTPLEM